jgi:hypothetical protein
MEKQVNKSLELQKKMIAECDIQPGQKINGKIVEKVIFWKIHYDMRTKIPCGMPSPTRGSLVCVADPDAELPLLQNKPHWVEDRFAILIIFKKPKGA